MRKVGVMAILALLMLNVFAAFVVAQDSSAIDVDFIKVDGDEVGDGDIIDVDRNEDISVKLRFEALRDGDDFRFEADIPGYEHGVISDSSDLFDVDEGRTYTETLRLHLPEEMDRDRYTLVIQLTDRSGVILTRTLSLDVDAARHAMEIEDVSFSPGTEIEAGRSLLATVRVENDGTEDEEAKVTVSIPDLGLSASDFVDEIESDETLTSEELFLRIPRCAAPGAYTLEVEVLYNDDFDSVSETRTIYIVDGGLCETAKQASTAQPRITLGQSADSVAAGEKATFPVSITNDADSAKTFVIEVEGTSEWASVEVSPTNVINLEGGASKTAYVTLTPTGDAKGKNVFNLAVKMDGTTLGQQTFSLDVEGASGWVKAVQVALIVVIVVIIVLGLIIAFNKIRGDEFDDLDEDDQTYY